MMCRAWFVLLSVLVCASSAFAQNNLPFKITAPDSTNNHSSYYGFKAYTGIPYDRPVTVSGGCAPFTAELTAAPSGMIIRDHSRRPGNGMAGPTGVFHDQAFELYWANPTGTSETVTIRATDCDGTQETSSFTLSIGTSGFKFFDASNGNNNNVCSLASPCQNLIAAFNTDKVDATDIMVFRTGTYATDALPGGSISSPGSDFAHLDWNIADGRPTQWIAYPGETVTLDFGWDGSPDSDTGIHIWVQGTASAVVDGFRIRNCELHCFRVSRNGFGMTLRNLDLTGVDNGAGGGDNAAAILYARSANSVGDVLIGVEAYDFPGDGGVGIGTQFIKIYDTTDMVIVYNSLHGGLDLPGSDGWIAPKGGVRTFSIRANYAADTTVAISGDMAHDDEDPPINTSGEIAYNLFLTDPTNECLTLGNPRTDETSEDLFVYRNTFQCDVDILGWGTEDETLTLTRNVVVNDGGGGTGCPGGGARYTCTNVTDASGIVQSNDLSGAVSDNILDANGSLQGQFLIDHGPASGTPKGHLISAVAAAPRPALRVRLHR